jgi:hypothetical protein
MEDEKIKRTDFDLQATYQTSRWHAQLLHRIAKPLFCRMIYHSAKAGKAGRASLLGKPSNVEVVKYFYSYLHAVIDEMAVDYRDGWKKKMERDKKTWIPDESSRVRIDFCFGAVGTIGDRLDKMYKEATEASSTSTALVVVNDHALEAAYKLAFPKTVNTNSHRMVDGTARFAGQLAGATIPLHRGVGGKERTRIS